MQEVRGEYMWVWIINNCNDKTASSETKSKVTLLKQVTRKQLHRTVSYMCFDLLTGKTDKANEIR